MFTRRHFLATSAAFAADLFAAPKDSKTPSPELEKLGDVALREAKKHKATYCDIRIVRLRDQTRGAAAYRPSAEPARRLRCRTSPRTRALDSACA